jgi:hypothetical protein
MTADRSDGLLAKHNLLIQIICSDWATRLDHKVAAEILERYMSKHGNSRVSLRYLEAATRATRANVIASLQRLAGAGAFAVTREGVGTRPTEYQPNFAFASGIADDTSTESRGIAGDTARGITGNTANAFSGIVGDTESLLLSPLTSRGQVRETSAPGPGASALRQAPARASVERVVRVVESVVEEDDGETWLNLSLRQDDDTIEHFSLCLESYDQETQECGQARIEKLVIALGLDKISEAADVVGIPFILTADDAFRPLSPELAATA